MCREPPDRVTYLVEFRCNEKVAIDKQYRRKHGKNAYYGQGQDKQ